MRGTDAHFPRIRTHAGKPHYLSNHRDHRQNPKFPKPPKTRHTSEVADAHRTTQHTKHDPTDRRFAPAFMRNDRRCRASFPTRHGIAYAYIAYAKGRSSRSRCNHASSRRTDWRVLASACIACMHLHTLHLRNLNGRLVLPLPKGRAKT